MIKAETYSDQKQKEALVQKTRCRAEGFSFPCCLWLLHKGKCEQGFSHAEKIPLAVQMIVSYFRICLGKDMQAWCKG